MLVVSDWKRKYLEPHLFVAIDRCFDYMITSAETPEVIISELTHKKYHRHSSTL